MRTLRKYFPVILLVLILAVAAFFRFYRIREYMTYLGDEGRDVLVVKRMLVDHKFTLLGPITSVGSMYMGPVYYYLMAPFLWAWHFDPVGPAVMVVLFSLATIYLIYRLGARFFHPRVGLIASFLYAISRLPIIHGRSSWNPNVVPFFAVLIIYSLMKIIIEKKYRWFGILGLALGILIQLHYVTMMFFPIIIACLFLIRFKAPIKYYCLGLITFLAGYSPFLIFELRHQFVNTQAVLRFLVQQKGESSSTLLSVWQTITDVFVRLFWRLLVVENAELTKLFIAMLMVGIGLYWYRQRKKRNNLSAIKIIILWLTVGILSFGLYRGITYDYYFGSLFAVPFILAGLFLYFIWNMDKFGKICAVIIFLSLVFFNLKNSPLRIPPNNLLRNTEEISRFVFEKTGGQPYNFALIAGKNSDHAYRYFLEVWGNPPITIENPVSDPQRSTVTNQLLVVCEEKICQPLGHSLWEIAGFGRAEIDGEWQVSTARVFRLVPYKI